MSALQEIERTAAQWLAREDRGLDEEGRTALDSWLNASTDNRIAYLRLKAVWQRADRLSVLKAPVWNTLPVRADRRGRYVTAAILVAAACAATVFFYRAPQTTYATTVGQTETVRLSDGSQIELNTNTRLRADVTDTGRNITLDQGEAFFGVVHDASRPFVVRAGDRKITDLGTRFSVRLDKSGVQVVVTEGRVRIERLDGSETATPVVAKANEVVLSKAGETLVAEKPSREIVDALSWRRGLLVFDGKPLSEVADEFNRYNKKQMVVEGPARNFRIGGSFEANNIDVFAALIQKGFDLKTEEENGKIVVSK